MSAEMMIGTYILSKADMLIDETIKDSFKAMMSHILKEKWVHKAKQGNALISKILSDDEVYNNFVCSHIMENLLIKTIDGKNKNIFIDDIFIESHVEQIDGGDIFNIKQIIELTKNHAVNIEGLAGQGKSTLARKLILECIKLKSHLPVFIELRKIKSDSSIIDSIMTIFSNAGLDANKDNTQSALMSKKILLLLDGYDELKSEDRERIYNEIEEIKIKFRTPLIITSRPDTAICNSTLVKGLRIQNLSREMALNLMEKRMDGETFIKSKTVLENNERLFDSLITPILVSLFCASYPETDFIPKTASDYYSRIFNILYEGHDKRKLFYDREKKLNLPTDLAKSSFDALCFLCFAASKISLTKDDILNEIKQCLNKIGIECSLIDRENYLEDLIQVTGLIKADGYDNYSFIHRSIMEYHASVYIKNSEKKKDYQSKISKELLRCNDEFVGLAEFLYDIDKESTLRNISLPLFEFFGFEGGSNIDSGMKEKLYNYVIGESRIGLVFYGERTHQKENKKIRESIFINKVDRFNDLSFVFNVFIDEDANKLRSFNDITQDVVFSIPAKRKYVSAHVKKIPSHEVDLTDSNSTSFIKLVEDMNLTEDLMNAFDKVLYKMKITYDKQVNTLNIISSSDSHFSL